MATPAPTRVLEQELWAAGHDIVVGIDEVGRGAWAGPLMVGAAVLPRDRRVNGVRDSKALSETARERMFDRVAEWCHTWAIGEATQAECDALGMSAAQQLAARRAIEGLAVRPDAAITDEASVAGVVQAHVAAKSLGIALLPSSDTDDAPSP